MKKLIIVGGRGNGLTVASLVEDINREEPLSWALLGFFNDSDPIGTVLNGYPVLGRPEDMVKYKDVFFVYAPLLAMPYGKPNAERLEKMGLPPERFATLIHPSAWIATHTQIGHGVVIMPMAHVRQNTVIGNHVTLLCGSSVGHDSTVADYSYLGHSVVIGAQVKLEKGAYLGTSVTTLERVTLGEWCLVGIGAVVIRDVPPWAVVAGNPTRYIRERTFEQFKKGALGC